MTERLGRHAYDNIQANSFIPPDTLRELYDDLVFAGDEQIRLASVAIEIALHPDFSRSDRRKYATSADAYLQDITDVSLSHERPREHVTHALLPFVFSRSKKAFFDTEAESDRRVEKLVTDFEEFFNDCADEKILGHSTELLDAHAVRSLGFSSITSSLRQDLVTTTVDGWLYNWDITATAYKGKFPPGNYFIQTKHCAKTGRAAKYHPDIKVHALHPEHYDRSNQKDVFILLKHHVGLEVNHPDPNRLSDLYFRRLKRSLYDFTGRPTPSISGKDAPVRPFVD